MLTNRRAVVHVDDDALVTDLVAEHLRVAGYEAAAVTDPTVAIETIFRSSFRIVLLDIHMPHISGLQLLQEIKRRDAGVRVIMFTALINETSVIEANRLGADACLFKPLRDPQPLVAAVDFAYQQNCLWWQSLHELARLRRCEQESLAAFKESQPGAIGTIPSID